MNRTFRIIAGVAVLVSLASPHLSVAQAIATDESANTSEAVAAGPGDANIDQGPPIFDGKSLDGWEGDPCLWSIRDGVIHGETTDEHVADGNTFLIYKQPASDFELRFSFRCNATNNSGVQYRSQRVDRSDDSTNRWSVIGYQHEIRNENQIPNVPSFIYDEGGKRGRICLVGEKATWDKNGKQVADEPLIDAADFQELMKVDEWNDVIIKANGNHIQHYLNGTLVLDFTDNHPEWSRTEGVIAFQLHAGAPMWAEFKDVCLKHID